MASFGWSAGDIVAAIKVVATIISALKDAGGASRQYQQTVQDLEMLEIVLRHLENVKCNDPTFAQANAICARSQASQRALRDLLDGFQKFEKTLGSGAPTGWHRGAHRKVQWALFASKELNKLQASLGMQLQSTMFLLQCQQLYVRFSCFESPNNEPLGHQSTPPTWLLRRTQLSRWAQLRS
jgi:hypothetical protein